MFILQNIENKFHLYFVFILKGSLLTLLINQMTSFFQEEIKQTYIETATGCTGDLKNIIFKFCRSLNF